MTSLKERELDLGRFEDGEEGAGLVLLGGERRQRARHSHLVPVPPDFANVDAVKVPQDVLVRDPKHPVVFSVH